MKKIKFLIIFLFILSCNTDSVPDCIRKTGKIITQTYELPEFHEIMTFDEVVLFIKDSSEQKVRVETGKNLLKDVKLEVVDGRLEIRNNNSCKLVRGSKRTKVYVSSPNLTFIHNGSPYDVKSTNTLKYQELSLKTDNFEEKNDYFKNGNFDLDLEVEKLTISSSSMSGYYLRGKADFFDIQLYGGVQRIEAAELEVINSTIYHRGFNDVILQVRDSISGQLLATGNLILVNTPAFIDVEEKYKGKVYIEE